MLCCVVLVEDGQKIIMHLEELIDSDDYFVVWILPNRFCVVLCCVVLCWWKTDKKE